MPKPFKNEQLDPQSEHHLRRNPLVKAWIKNYQRDKHNKHEDCRLCGWPHGSVEGCGLGTTFGSLMLGGRTTYVDTSNVEYLLEFVSELSARGFHWRNEVYIARRGANVVISRIEHFNGTPHLEQWTIQVNEFASIVCAASLGGETAERYQEAVAFLGTQS